METLLTDEEMQRAGCTLVQQGRLGGAKWLFKGNYYWNNLSLSQLIELAYNLGHSRGGDEARFEIRSALGFND